VSELLVNISGFHLLRVIATPQEKLLGLAMTAPSICLPVQMSLRTPAELIRGEAISFF